MTNIPLPNHSEAKLRLLEAYLDRYLRAITLSGRTEEIFLVDLFCGPGMYAGEKPGSPVAIGRKLSALHAEYPGAPKTTFLFNDADEFNTKNAHRYLQPLAEKHTKLALHHRNLEAEDLLPELHRLINSRQKCKVFYFVDPFGYSQLKLSEILGLLDNRNAELLLFQPSSFMFRFSKKGTPEALAGLLAELGGTTPWPESVDIMDYIRHTKLMLRKKIRQDQYVGSFTLKTEDNNVNCLFFFTSHIRGHEKMLEAKWKFNSVTGQGWHYASPHASDDLFQGQYAQTQELEHALTRLLNIRGYATNAEIYFETLEHEYLPKHAREILSTWQNRGIIRVDPEPKRKGAFYLDYSHHQTDKMIIRVVKVAKQGNA